MRIVLTLSLLLFSGCANTLHQLTLTHYRTYKVVDTLPQGSEPAQTTLEKQIDLDLVKTTQGLVDIIGWGVEGLFGIGDLLFKVATTLIVEGPPESKLLVWSDIPLETLTDMGNQ